MNTTHQIFLKEIVLNASVGVNPEEKNNRQNVIVSVTVDVKTPEKPIEDTIEHVLSYDDILKDVERIVLSGHTHLLEILAERIKDSVLCYPQAAGVTVIVEKPDIYEHVKTAGVKLTCSR
ncbi:MAG: dihydroneopterin aldolase [Alphaproteobacteria bacterium]|nr:dihydroneopterin aldolase [Alphaproteobacteria bacterium]